MIRLTRTITVSTFDVEATVAVGRDRPELLAVARLAADMARPIGARDVLRELLGARPEVLGWRIIDRCVDIGLLHRVGKNGEAALSPDGQVALNHGEVLVPEEGVWRFFLVDDPLVPAALIHVRRLETEPVRREREAAREARGRGERIPPSERIPELLRQRCEGGPLLSVRNGHLFRPLALGSSGASGARGQLRLDLTWDTAASLRLSGRLSSDEEGEDAKPIDASLDLPEVLNRWTRDGLWKALAASATRVPAAELERWRGVAGRSVMPCSFSSLSETARRSFRRDIDVPAVDLPALGRFDATALKDVPIVPASQADAQEWMAWLQWDSIQDHVLPVEIERKGRELLASFPHHQPNALTAFDLLSRARTERGARSWFLFAPSDLGLWS